MSDLMQPGFEDRRGSSTGTDSRVERRQFASSHNNLSPAGAELARAIDQYKATNRRRFINCDEILTVLESLGYEKVGNSSDSKTTAGVC